MNILEACRHDGVEHLVYASSSSVYGANRKLPFSVRGQRRPSGQPVRGDQEGQRADGAHLQPSVRPADHRPALLHRLRTLGPAGHGAVPVHPQDPRRRADRRVQPRPPHPRLHLHRRHRRRRDPHARPRARPRSRPTTRWHPTPATSQRAVPRLQHRQPPAGGAAALHRGARRNASAARPRRSCCRCSPATCPTPMPTSRRCSATPAIRPSTPIETGVGRFVDWYRDFYRAAEIGLARCGHLAWKLARFAPLLCVGTSSN